MSNYPHILIIKNAASTNAQGNQAYIAAIKQTCPDSTFETLAVDNALARLSAKVRKGTLLCVIGGDGTVNSVVSALLHDPALTESQRRTPVLPLWGGNANDIAHILNGNPAADTCQRIIKQGKTVPIYPLRCTITAEGKPDQTRIAICYASFGATAHAARQLNKRAFRKKTLPKMLGGQMVREAAVSLKALHDAPTFAVVHEGKRRNIYDWIIGKGPRMAKLLRLPVNLTDQSFYQSVVERKWLPGVVFRAAQLAWGKPSPATDRKPVVFTTLEPLWAQFDGEPLHVPASATISISLNSEPFFALSAQNVSDTLKA